MLGFLRKFILLFFIFVLTSQFFQCFSQNNTGTSNYESELSESIINTEDDGETQLAIGEDMQQILDNPIDLNIAKEEDFEKLKILTPFQIASIIDYRQAHSVFTSVFELNGVDVLPLNTVAAILPYVTVNEDNIKLVLQQKKGLNQQFLLKSERTIEQQKGFSNPGDSVRALSPNGYYAGNPYRVKARYKFDLNESLYLGFHAEKDPGETWFSSNNKTFDYLSGYVQYKNWKFIKNIIVGDYYANFGQGLVCWSGYSLGKSAYSTNIEKMGSGFAPYSSSDENQFLRGVATTFKMGSFNLATWASSKHRDANVLERDSFGKAVEVSSLQNTGLHALPSEIAEEDVLGEKSFGANLAWRFGRGKVAGTFSQTNYSIQLGSNDELYRIYSFKGTEVQAGSFNYQYTGLNWSIFGEAAHSSNGGNAFLNGISCQMLSELSISVLHRWFEPGYFAPYAKAFASGSSVSNEKGLYVGTEYSPFRHWRISSYADFFERPWLTYSTSAPTKAVQYFSEVGYTLVDSFSAALRYSRLTNETNQNSGYIKPLVNSNLQKIRLQLAYHVSTQMELRNRIEWALNNQEKESVSSGFIVYQDVIYRTEQIPLSVTCRYAWFDAPNWTTRLYAYENDVLYASSVALYYGKGSKIYAMLKYKLSRRFSFWLRYSRTMYVDKQTIGNGAGEINGNHISEATLQMIVKL